MAIQGKELAVACARAADETKAERIRVWDMRGLSNLTDFMVVCSGTSLPQLRAILRDVAGKVGEEHGVKPVHAEGKADSRWVVLDFIDVMVHVMDQELRDYYGLEELWKDATEVEWRPEGARHAG
jgi:ribosome-associated protein